MIDRLEAIARRYHEIESEMARPDVASDHAQLTKLAREQRSLREIVGAYDAFRKARGEAEAAREMLKHEKDSDMQGGGARGAVEGASAAQGPER